MSMTPQEIQEKHFHDTFRGYSHEEVDLFLDEVAVAFERLYRENQSFMRRVVDLEEQLKRAQEATGTQPARAQEAFEEDSGVTESTLKRMLLIAQETADRAVQEARQRAREIQEQARARADEMMEHAEKRVRELSSQRMEKEKELERAKDALRRFDQQYRASFRVFIESQLEALKDLPAAPPGAEIEAPLNAVTTFEPLGELPESQRSLPPGPIGMETVAMPIQPADPAPFPADFEQAEAGAFEQEPLDRQDEALVEIAPEPAPVEWNEEAGPGSSGSIDDPELVRPARGISQPGSEMEAAEEGENEVQSAQASRGRSRRERRQGKDADPGDSKDAEEDRLIRELFWGEED